jgi:hypothetical protein
MYRALCCIILRSVAVDGSQSNVYLYRRLFRPVSSVTCKCFVDVTHHCVLRFQRGSAITSLCSGLLSHESQGLARTKCARDCEYQHESLAEQCAVLVLSNKKINTEEAMGSSTKYIYKLQHREGVQERDVNEPFNASRHTQVTRRDTTI